MRIRSSFAHVNLITTDLPAMVAFYQQLFGCIVVTPDHVLTGRWVEAITGVPGAEIRVAHLRLPGFGEEAPTLELIQYSDPLERPTTAPNRPGFGHIAFAVEDVEAARDAVIAAGGSAVGDIVTVEISGRGRVTEVYVTDPEGNILELQRWS